MVRGFAPRGTARARRRGLVIAAVTVSLLASLFGSVTPVLAATFVVTSTGDAPDAAANGICATAAGVCTLRAAVQEANANPGADVVTFNIPGTGVQTIALGSRIDVTGTGGVTINGYSQPGSSANTDPLGSNAVIRIAITGLGDEEEVPGFFVTSSGNTFRGLSMYDLWRKIWMAGPNAGSNLVAGNFIGTNPAGTVQSDGFVGTAAGGILIDNGAHDNIIGEATLAGRNVISGNPRSGIQITQVGTARNIVRNNIIGLSPDGLRELGNRAHGVDNDQGPNGSIIGGTGALQRNVISGNDIDGVEIVHEVETANNQVIGNYIGTDLTGTRGPAYARNGDHGIHVDDGAQGTIVTDNVVGNNGSGGGIVIEGALTSTTTIARNRVGVSLDGTAIPNAGVGVGVVFHPVLTTIGPDNIIANHFNGIEIGPEADVDRNRITRNSIFGNSGMGIEVHPAGISPNGHHPATGPNQAVPFPSLATATTTTVTGRACGNCVVEVFKADGGSGQFGDGMTFAGSATAAAGGTFTATVTGLALGDHVTATATDSNGNSSEFSLNRLVTASGVSAPGTLIAQDSFTRTLTDAWGTPPAGGPYSIPGSKLEYDVTGTIGTFSMTPNQTRSSLLSSHAESDIDLTIQVRTDKTAAGSNQWIYVPVRIQGTNEYRPKVRLATNGTVFVGASQVLANVETTIGSEIAVPGLTHAANQPIWLRARITGTNPTTIRVKAWANGSLQPAAWNYTSTNSAAGLQSPGSLGFRSYIGAASNSPVVVGFDEFRASVAGPEDAVAPAAPQNLVGSPGSNSVYLSWNAGAEPDLAGYHVYRSLTAPVPTTGTPLSGSGPVSGTTYVDDTAVNGTTYHYVVTAADVSANRSGASNQVTVTPDQAAGAALDFDGANDYVTFGPAPGLGVTAFTLETWFRRDGAGVATATSGGSGGVTAIPLVTKGRSEDDGTTTDMNFFLGIRSSDNVLAADFEDNDTGANHAVAGVTPITSGVWHHAAATYNGSTWRLYLDGVLDATLNIGGFTPRSDSIQHGALATSIDSTGLTAGQFDGVLDEVRLWNTARSTAQIVAARGQQLTSGTGLVARWGMNEGTGTQVINSVAGGVSGTAIGGPAWVPGAPFTGSGDPPPATPTGLAGTPGPGRADLTWNANSESDLAGYNVYRSSVLTGPTVSAVAAGDIASCSSTGDEATANLLDTIPGTVLALGDNVYEDGTVTEFNNCYNPTWGRAKARTAPTSGNHEYQTANASGYYAYFGAAAGPPSQGYYSYDYGTWHVVVLNSNCAIVACAAGSAQDTWLRADLAANDEVCTLAYFHHPRFSSGDSHGNDASVANFWDALYDANADLILTGHDHTYERFGPQTPAAVADPVHGIRQFVVGTGGRSHNGFATIRANSQVRNGDTYGVLKLDLRAGGYSWQFVPEAGRTFTDTGSDSCHDANGPVGDSGTPLNGDAPISTPSYSDTNVVAGTNYTYTVTAVDAVGQESPASTSVNVTPTQPTNNALDFDGTNDHATLGNAAALNSNTFTVETWFRRDGTGVTTTTSATAPGLLTAIPLVTKGRAGGSAQVVNWFLGIDATTNRIAADFESADDTNHGIIGTTTLANGTWYHAAATYDGTTFRLYLDGNLEASVAVAAGPGTGSTHPAALATALDTAGVPAGFFNGVIDETRIWNVARTAAQIAAARPLELTSGTGLISRWGLNQGAGSSLANSIAGGPTGTAVGGVPWTAGFVVTDIAPAAPTGFTASPGNNSVSLSWAANGEPDLAGYRVYRGTSTPVSTVGAPLSGGTLLTSPSYVDATAVNGTTYHYVVTAVDAAGQASPASTSASATPSASAGSALDFDGTNDHVTLGPASGLNSDTFTIETWFRRDGAGVLASTTTGTGGVSAAPLMAKGLSGGGVINWFMGVTGTGQLAADFESESDDSNHAIIGSTVIANGTWHHAAATYDGTTFRLYLDGALEASVTETDGPGSASNHPPSLATAMTPAGVATGFFNGVLDESRVWNVARTAAQVAAGMSQELTSGTGLTARYGMNEGAGSSVANSVAGGPAGGAVGGPQWVAGAPFNGTGNPAPAAPTGFTASPGNNSVSLSWAANGEPDLAGYRVYRGTSTPVSTVGAPLSGGTLLTSPSYVDATAVNGTTYHYVVTAVDAAGQASPASTSASATPSASTNSALDFDGTNDHVTLGGQSAFNSNLFTIETWFRRDGTGVATGTSGSAPGLVSAIPLVTKGRTGGTAQIVNWFLGIDTATNRIAADFETAGDDVNHGIIGTTTLVNGTWYHAAATYDGTTFRVYLNGVQENSVAVAAGPGAGSTHPAALATALDTTGAPAGFFNGVLDEVRIWNLSRSAAQVLASKDQELTSGTGLTARYGLNEGAGASVGNSIPAGINGNAVNGPLWVTGAPFGGGGDPAPASPTGLTATPGNNSVSLNWTPNSESDIAGYNVYRDGAPAGPTVQAVGAGDIASCSSSGDEATAALLATISGDVLAIGDTVYESGTASEYTNCYNPSWGVEKTRTRPVVGNHEYGTANASGYFNYFGAAAGTPGQGYYSYDYGAWHIIVLNSMCANAGGCGTGSPQLNWLVADLANSDADCTMALWHHPLTSSSRGVNTVTQPLFQALYNANADLILTGHDHTYERFAPQTATRTLDTNRGIRQFVVGTGGRSHYGMDNPQPNSEVFNGDTYGVIKLQLKPTSFEWEFVPEAGKTFTDSGSDECHDANGPITTGGPMNGGTPLTSPSFVDTSAVNGTSYEYVVTAVDDADQESDPSGPASATPTTGSALDFDGTNDYVTFGAAPSLNSNTFTIETWFRRDGTGVAASTSGTNGVNGIPLVTKGRSETGAILGWFLGIDSVTNRIAADFESESDDSNHAIVGTTTLVNGTWYHAAATYDGTTFRLYLNGTLEASAAVANGPGTSSAHHAALATTLTTTGVAGGFFDGALDEARVWNIARTGAEIAAARQLELTSGTGLVGRWGINEGSGATIGNSIAGGVGGTAVSNPLWIAGAPFTGGTNEAPVFSSDLPDRTDPEGATVSFAATATDPDFDTLTYSATGLPIGIIINPSSGVIGGTLGATSSGTHSVVVTVNDGSLTDTDSFTWTVTDVASTNSALDFDGTNDHVTLGGQSAFNSNLFTIETWFRRDGTGVATGTSGSAPGLVSAIPLVTKGRTGGTAQIVNWFLGIDTATNRIAADFETAGDDVNHGIIGTTTLVNGTWYHAAATYDGTTFRVYLNGVQENSVAVAAGPGAGSTHPAALATALDTTGAPAGFFNGVLDEVRIWNLSRSAAQVLASKDQELTSGTGLTARYGLNEGAGASVGNSIPAGINGNAVNGPLWVTGFPVSSGNQPPVFVTDLLDRTNAEGTVVSFDVDATDPNPGDTLIYSATGLPNGISINGGTGVVSGTLSATSAGVHSVTVTVSDGSLSDSEPFTWTVTEPSAATGLDFDGSNDFVSFGAASALNTNAFTVETWFKREGAGVTAITSSGAGGITAVPLVTKGRSGTGTINYFLGITSDGRIAADFESANDDNHGIIGSTVIADGVWHHAAATYDGTNFVVYLDGGFEQSVSTTAGPGTASVNHAALATALSDTGAAAGFFNGVLDEARIWNVARTPAQLGAGMSQEITSAAGLIGRWGMNEGAGATVANSVASGPGGTTSGGPVWVSGSPFTPPPPPNLPPASPTLVGPTDGTTGVPVTGPTLSVGVSDPEGTALNTTFYGRESAPAAGEDFTIVALPDTQHYVDSAANYPRFQAQTQWIVDNRDTLNTVFVTHEGDVVEHVDASELEWQRADAAMDTLDNAGVPNNLTIGNHDVNTTTGVAAFFDQYFPPSRYTGFDWYGGYLGQLVTDPINRMNKNNYELFSAGGLDFVILHLELDIPDYALTWADGILNQYPDRLAIITTHLFVDTANARRTTSQFMSNGNSAEAIWQELIRPNCNVIMVLNGHYPGEGRRTDLNDCGEPVHQILADYQERTNGGDGWLRIMTFKPAENKIYVYTFSPTLDAPAGRFETDANSQFVLDLDLQGGGTFQPLGTVTGTASGGTASVAWPGLEGSTEYQWYAVASDGTSTTTSSTWTFETEADIVAPAAPAGLVATAGANSVSLAWNGNSEPDLAGYNVYRSTTSPVLTTGTPLNGGTLVATPSYADTTAVGGTTYFYAVTAVDESDNASSPSNEGTATPTVPTGSAIDFDGSNDIVTFGNAAGLNVTTFTIETWFRRDGAGVGTTTGSGGIASAIPLVAKGAQQAETPLNINMNWFLGIDAGSGVLVADFEDNATGLNHPVSGVTPVTSNVWHHAAAVYDTATDTWQLYLDGVLDRTLATGGNFTPENTSVQHGALGTSLNATGGTNGFFNGVLDEVRLWNVARSGAQIAATKDHSLSAAPGSSLATVSTKGSVRAQRPASLERQPARSPMAHCGSAARRSRHLRPTAPRSSAPTSRISRTARASS